MTYVITAGCIDVTDKTCIGECPVDCIYEGQRMLYINPDECIDCGACEPVCPAEAIYFEVDVPAPLLPFVGATARFVADVHASGGASNRGALEGDADLVAGWPAKTGE